MIGAIVTSIILIVYLHMIWIELTKIRKQLTPDEDWTPPTDAQIRARMRLEDELGD